jgi:hypothetical protein
VILCSRARRSTSLCIFSAVNAIAAMAVTARRNSPCVI